MTEPRHPSSVPVYWTAEGPGIPPGAILVSARLAITARDAARLYLRRRGFDYHETERVQVREWKLNGKRQGVLLNEAAEELGS